MPLEHTSELIKSSENCHLNTSSLMPTILDFQNTFQLNNQARTEPAFLDFGNGLYGGSEDTLVADGATEVEPKSYRLAHESQRALESKTERATTPENFRSNYDTADEAAKAAFKECYRSSQLQTAEYGARIYKDPVTNKYGYTAPYRYPEPNEPGYQDNLDPLTHAPIPDVPPGMVPFARLHTHVVDNGTDFGMQSLDPQPKTVSAKIVSGDPGDLFNNDPNRFSPMDLTNAKNEHQSSYLATPNGTLLRYDSETGQVSPIGSVEK